MSSVWKLVHQERLSLIDDLSELPVEDWSRPSLCPGWSVQDVVAHLIGSAQTTPWSFVTSMIRARFDFDQQNQTDVEKLRHKSPQELMPLLASVAHRTTGPPTFMAPLASRLVEEVVHGEDIRRPLGIPHQYAPEAVAEAIEYQAKTSENFGGAKERLKTINVQATDADINLGTGRTLRAPALDLLMFLTGREPLD